MIHPGMNPCELKGLAIARGSNPCELKSLAIARRSNPCELKGLAIARGLNPRELKVRGGQPPKISRFNAELPYRRPLI